MVRQPVLHHLGRSRVKQLCLAMLILGWTLNACKAPTDQTPTCRVSGITVTLAAAQIDVGAATTATAAVTAANCGTLSPQWESDQPAIAAVAATGVVTGVTSGTATIRATIGSVAGSAQVTVRACTVSAVDVTPATNTIPVAGTVTLSATITQQGCSGVTVAWESVSPAVATVSAAGVVTGVTPGSATIRATANGTIGTAQVTVQPPPVGATWSADRLVVAGSGEVPAEANSIVAFGPNSVFVGGRGIHRYDGSSWAEIQPAAREVFGLWGSGSTNLYAVGRSGLLQRWDGSTWTSISSGVTTNLVAIWGSGTIPGFAVGEQGAILRFDGTAWVASTSPTTETLRAVHGSSPTNVMAVGDNGTVLRYDGANWTTLAFPGTPGLTALWVLGPLDAVAVDGSGRVYRFDGATWAETALLPTSLLGVWGTGPNDLYVVGANGYVARFDGTAWAPLDSRVAYRLRSVTGAGGAVYAAGHGSVVALAPTVTRLAYVPDLTGVWMLSADNAVATSDAGIIWRYSGGTWQFFDSGNRHYFADAWASGPNEVIVVGGTYPFRQQAVVARFNGAAWSETIVPTGAFFDAWGSGPGNAYATGSFDALTRWNGATWTPIAAGSFGTMEAIWGTSISDVLAVGRNGATLRFDGASWTIGSLGAGETARGVWGSTPGAYHAVTQSGRIYSFDGAAWTMAFSQPIGFVGIAGSGTEVLAVSYSGSIARFDGSAWSSVFNGFSGIEASAIHGAGGRYMAVGQFGFVMMTP